MFLKLITFKQHTFLLLKNTKKLDWIYWKKLLLQGPATLFFIGLVSYRSSPKKWIIWEYLSLKNEENSRTISIKKRLLGLIKEIAFLLLWIIAPIFWKIRWLLPLMLIFRLNIFNSKTFILIIILLYSFWGRENGLKPDKIYNMNFHIWVSLYIIISLYEHILRMDAFILHQVHYTLLWMSG